MSRNGNQPEAPVMPQALDAEESVLGACMMSDKAADMLVEGLRPGQFYRESHSLIFRAIGRLREQGKAADPIVLSAELERSGQLEQVGGRVRVHELAVLTPAVSNAGHYAKIIRDTAGLRSLIHAGGEISRLGWEGFGEFDNVLGEAERVFLTALTELEGRKADRAWTGAEAAAAFRAELADPPDEAAGIPTPFTYLRRLQPGRLHVLGGYAGEGKTAIAMQFARSACEEGRRVGFVTLEMSREDMRDRLISTFGVPYPQVQARRVTSAYLPTVERALATIAGWPLVIIDDARDVFSISRRQRVRRFEFLIVDHLHRFAWKERRDLENIVQSLTELAVTELVPVLLCAQLHRPVGGGDFPRPSQTSFRETGTIEQEAALAMAIWRKRDQGRRTTEAELIVMKNRFGREGYRRLRFVEEEVRFEEVATS